MDVDLNLTELIALLLSKIGYWGIIFTAIIIVAIWGIYLILKSQGWIKNRSEDSLVQMSKDMGELLSIQKKGFNSREKVDIIKSFAHGMDSNLREGLVAVLMDIYENWNDGQSQDDLDRTIRYEFQAVIKDIDNKINLIPCVERYSKTTTEKYSVVKMLIPSFIKIIMAERDPSSPDKDIKNARRQFKNSIKTILINSEL